MTSGNTLSEWTILIIMPLPPRPVRPDITVDGGAMRGEDDLTYILILSKHQCNVRGYKLENGQAPPSYIV
jgi:DNA-directed RNA polymerase beta' subunit